MKLDPTVLWTNLYLVQAYAQVGMYEQAVATYQSVREHCDESPLLRAAVGHVYASAGETGKARDVLSELLSLSKHKHVSLPYLAHIHVALGERDEALECLARACDEHNDPHVQFLKVDPQFDSLRPDPRFDGLLRRIGLAS